MATKNAVLQVRVNGELKSAAQDVLTHLGLTMSDAVNALFSQIRLKQSLPFELNIPNRVTRKTIEKSAKGHEVKRFGSVDELFEDLEN